MHGEVIIRILYVQKDSYEVVETKIYAAIRSQMS